MRTLIFNHLSESGSPRARYGAALLLAVITCVFLLCWVERERILDRAAELWAVSDEITRAEAVVVLGGNFHVRPSVAADLYSKGLVEKVLVSQTADAPLNIAALVKAGVSKHDIETFGNANTNTRLEVAALRHWAQKTGIKSFIVPSEIFSARRVQWIIKREFSGTGIRVEVAGFEQPGFSLKGWWRSEQSLRLFETELAKYVYYRLVY